MRDIAVLIPAGGIGARLGRRTPKQFLRIGREAILAATVGHFRRHPRVAAIIVAAPGAHVAHARRLLGAGVTVVAGGATRQESVRLALEAAPPGVRVALVHDAVRPFITRALVDAVLAAARADGAAICALPVAETVKRVRDGVAGTDDAMLVERLGHRVRVVPGLAGNVKITTPDDLRRARQTRPTRGEPR
jgi:2-C-methyl-D-erythritol 4-phosphate cytidylyltransferase